MKLSTARVLRRKIKTLTIENRALKQELDEREKLENQLIQAQKIEALATLSGSIAHDFNNILQALLGYTQLAITKLEQKELKRVDLVHLESIMQKGKLLTEQLLTLGKKRSSSFILLNINRAVREIEKFFLRMVPETIEIKTDLADNLRPVSGIPVQIEQILLNLCLNAVDAMENTGRLTIKTENRRVLKDIKINPDSVPKGEYVVLSISDTGPGIAADIQSQIFKPFFTTKSTGTGLGLPFVFSIIKDHNGFIDCISADGRDTVFEIYFPVSPVKTLP